VSGTPVEAGATEEEAGAADEEVAGATNEEAGAVKRGRWLVFFILLQCSYQLNQQLINK
jgi:hypothetical protein